MTLGALWMGKRKGGERGVTRRVDAAAVGLVRKEIGFGSVEGIGEQRRGRSGGKRGRETRGADAAAF